jgi:hypothetical protein
MAPIITQLPNAQNYQPTTARNIVPTKTFVSIVIMVITVLAPENAINNAFKIAQNTFSTITNAGGVKSVTTKILMETVNRPTSKNVMCTSQIPTPAKYALKDITVLKK